MTHHVRFDPRPEAWLPVPVSWPAPGLESPLHVAVAAETLRFGARPDRAAEKWGQAFAKSIAELEPEGVDQQYVWIGSDMLPPMVLRVTQFDAVGEAEQALAAIAGLDGSVPGAVPGAADMGGAVAVRSDRPVPGRAKSFRRAAEPDRVEVRWAVRLQGEVDVLVEMSATPLDLVETAAQDAVSLLATAQLVDSAAAAKIDEDAIAHALERWEAARVTSLSG